MTSIAKQTDKLVAAEVCECWCQAFPQPEYDSWRDYFEAHLHGDCDVCDFTQPLIAEAIKSATAPESGTKEGGE